MTVTVKLADPPRVHKLAIDPYRLAIWSQWPGKAIEVIKNANGGDLDASWPEIESGEVTTVIAKLPEDDDLTLRLAMIDPIGRMSTITTVPI